MRLSTVILAALAAAGPALAEDASVFEVYDRIVLSAEAARQCHGSTQLPNARFVQAFVDVTRQATRLLEEQNPALSREESIELIGQRRVSLAGRVESLMGTEGCSGPTMRALVKLYDAQANWDPYAPRGEPR